MAEIGHDETGWPRTWGRRDTASLTALVFAFTATRGAWIFLSPDTASYWEESYRWIAAEEILAGSSRPLFEYQADHYQGGSLFMILLVIPFFALLGPSVISLKLPAIGISLLTLTVLYTMVRRFFGGPAALLAGLAYTCGPPLVAFWGLTLMGFHAESTLLSLIQISSFLCLLTPALRTPASWGVFGFACGAGISFAYTTLLSAAACGLSGALLSLRPRRRELAIAGTGLAAGAIPWIAYNATHGFAGLGRVAEVFGLSRSYADVWAERSIDERLYDLFVRAPTEGLIDPTRNALPDDIRVLVSAAILVPTSLALLASLVRQGRALTGPSRRTEESCDPCARREVVFGVYGVLFVCTFLASRFTFELEPRAVEYRLFPPLVVLLIVPVCVTAQRMLSRGGGARYIAAAAAGLCLAATAGATFAFANRPPDPGSQLTRRQGYAVFGHLLHRKDPSLSGAIEETRLISDHVAQADALRGIGMEVRIRFETGGDLEEIVKTLGMIPPDERRHVLDGLRWGAQERADVLAAREPSHDPYLEGLARMRALEAWAREERARLDAIQLPTAPSH